MRLTSGQQQIIVSTLQSCFGENSLIMLFGSRVDDAKKGGDIDLYIEPEISGADEIIDAKIDALVQLHKLLGEQKIDLVINRKGSSVLPIYSVAKEQGIVL